MHVAHITEPAIRAMIDESINMTEVVQAARQGAKDFGGHGYFELDWPASNGKRAIFKVTPAKNDGPTIDLKVVA